MDRDSLRKSLLDELGPVLEASIRLQEQRRPQSRCVIAVHDQADRHSFYPLSGIRSETASWGFLGKRLLIGHLSNIDPNPSSCNAGRNGQQVPEVW
jgi:hypothetical protein